MHIDTNAVLDIIAAHPYAYATVCRRDADGPCYCAIGALAHAAGLSDEELRLGSTSGAAEYIAEQRLHGLTDPAFIVRFATFNDAAWDEHWRHERGERTRRAAQQTLEEIALACEFANYAGQQTFHYF